MTREGDPVLQCDIRDGVAMLRLARPDRGNALSAELTEALISGIQAIFDNREVHTLVLSAVGRNFCTGFDLSNIEAEDDASLFLRFVRVEMLLALIALAPIRTIACGHGRIWGAGADLFTACDIRAIVPGVSLKFPGAGFGLVLGTRRLALRTSPEFARRCTIDGIDVSAQLALDYGLATEICTNFDADWLAMRSARPVPDRATVASLRQASQKESPDTDLAILVRSAARPGLKRRIMAYRAGVLAARDRHPDGGNRDE